ncbi:Crp/Fnr family transcriptional regulator [Roseibium denhamense]|uniref:cAMP-binding domain of CRP or a regulatory subunit of cAMP-dependent protein kinases n=1 Tax=Roseibium denhamense TaxID=76305 RepID=A0ABY1PJB9_9HYPH|nr:Crp/Fnr family transcriptional regulator [Roseibium denhamense]MTI05587.1 Crp/Fnr family transcriptional regulator [Roseibium denhamense]SMP34564.1 cAMP-binding domain of CRP or a regulatory subunit of cAMP-dependent protein kinases [Roseibium denhamense]
MNDTDNLDKAALLSRSFIFDALDDQEKQELAKFAFVKRYKAGETIYTMGTPGQSMAAIAEGSVRVSVLTPTAREITLNELRKGDVFGEIAVLDGRERSATVKALTNCTLVILERRELLGVLQRNPAFAIQLIELLCQRVRRSDERMLEIAFLELPVRLARLLLRLTEVPPASPQKPLAKLSQSQSELAAMIGNTRENVNRCLGKWQKAELVSLKDGWLIIEDRAALEALADSD